jgi:hypothetical protein
MLSSTRGCQTATLRRVCPSSRVRRTPARALTSARAAPGQHQGASSELFRACAAEIAGCRCLDQVVSAELDCQMDMARSDRAPEPQPQRPTCIDCGAAAPETNTNYTLISTSFGWRLTRRTLPGGVKIVEWRCSNCWRKHKSRPGASDGPPTGSNPRPAGLRTSSSRPPPGKPSSRPPRAR